MIPGTKIYFAISLHRRRYQRIESCSVWSGESGPGQPAGPTFWPPPPGWSCRADPSRRRSRPSWELTQCPWRLHKFWTGLSRTNGTF